MTQKAVNNAKVLYRLNISRSDVEEAHKIFTKAPFLLETLTNPVVSEEAKEELLENQRWTSESDWYVSSSYAASLKDDVPDW